MVATPDITTRRTVTTLGGDGVQSSYSKQTLLVVYRFCGPLSNIPVAANKDFTSQNHLQPVIPTIRRKALTGAKTILEVIVRDNNVEQAMRVLKKKMQREGLFREMKLRRHYEKPSEKRVREQDESIRRARKLMRKRREREGS